MFHLGLGLLLVVGGVPAAVAQDNGEASALEVAAPPTNEGLSFAPVLRGERTTIRDVLYDATHDVLFATDLGSTSGVSDGLLWTEQGVLVSALEEGAIKRVTPDGEVSTVVQDPRIIWPDSFAQGPDGVYFTTAQIHLGLEPPTPYRILRLQ